ncbi:uncharacterized protein BX663DRAFT_547665 [Cokeromyces recurvatus]|uniref:uncharacterized protein n=1 Tax=Cokeromyces recurvatus TaxID=90255 RepID=UPI00221F5A7F|nr:uncharacterized protein BX663DRAFT_547665 [Cokeromyces recurvatus]KAI7908032.1 hypothetical protein BX663DRAFT_547665 [Cokeromyces recurvatus]
MSNEHDELLRRLQNLETLLQQQHSAPVAAHVDPYLTPRPTTVDLQPYDEFYDVLSDAAADFFRSPLSEADCRKFLNLCPSNSDRRYRAPVLQRSVNARCCVYNDVLHNIL